MVTSSSSSEVRVNDVELVSPRKDKVLQAFRPKEILRHLVTSHTNPRVEEGLGFYRTDREVSPTLSPKLGLL